MAKQRVFSGTGKVITATTTSTELVFNQVDASAAGWVDFIDLQSASGAATVFFMFNCTEAAFDAAVTAGTTPVLADRLGNPLVLDFSGHGAPIYNMWYNVAVSTQAFTINAR